MTYILIALCSLAILVVILIILGLILGLPGRKIKRYTIAVIASVLVIQLVHFLYDIALTLQTIDIEFYVALLGGAVTVIIYNDICNRKKKVED